MGALVPILCPGSDRSTDHHQQMSTKVQITVELLEKLAGKKPQRQRQRQKQHQHQQQLARSLGLGVPLPQRLQQHDVHRQREQELQQVVHEVQRVGDLLLKEGDQELAAVQQQASQLLDKFRSQLHPLPCGPEREAVLRCYKEHGQDVLACSGFINAYHACAQQPSNA